MSHCGKEIHQGIKREAKANGTITLHVAIVTPTSNWEGSIVDL